MADNIKTKCYLCNQPTRYFLEKNSHLLKKCSACGLIMLDCKDDYSKIIKNYYKKEYFQGDKKSCGYFDYSRDKQIILKNMMNYFNIVSSYKKNGNLLDIGCAYGYFVELATNKGYVSYGIDPSDYAIKEARKRLSTKKVFKAKISDLKVKKGFFDVVTMFDVFEHLHSPKADLKKIKSMLKPDGLLVIETGDTGSTWAKIFGKRWTFFNPPQHVYYYNKENIRYILEQIGYEILEIKKIGKWVSLSYILHLASTVGEIRLANLLNNLIKKTNLGKISVYVKLNDNMFICARNKS